MQSSDVVNRIRRNPSVLAATPGRVAEPDSLDSDGGVADGSVQYNTPTLVAVRLSRWNSSASLKIGQV